MTWTTTATIAADTDIDTARNARQHGPISDDADADTDIDRGGLR